MLILTAVLADTVEVLFRQRPYQGRPLRRLYGQVCTKNMVAAGLADYLELQVAYTIGKAHPLSLSIETFGTGKVSDETIMSLMNKHFDFRPEAIIGTLDLRRPIYRQTATYGHFGRKDLDLPWEKTDKAKY